LVKWEGYPDADNMWVNKDDIFADDKVWDFKHLNPAKETHIRRLLTTKSLHPSAHNHSHLLQQHTLQYMSSNGGSDLANKYPAGAYADSASGNEGCILNDIQETITQVSNEGTASMLRALATPFEPRPTSPSAVSIADAFRQLSLADPSDAIIDNNPDHILMLRVPEALIIRNEDSLAVASGAASGSQEEARPEEVPAMSGWHASVSLLSPSDIGFCSQGNGPREYCHGHTSPVPTPVPAPVDPIPILAPSTCPPTVGHFCLTHEEAMSLVDNIANALKICHEDTPEVPPPYPKGLQAAKGMGIQHGRGQRGRP
jgi:hypothetical protein